MWIFENSLVLSFILLAIMMLMSMDSFLMFLLVLETYLMTLFCWFIVWGGFFDLSLMILLLLFSAAEACIGLCMLVSKASKSGLSSSFNWCDGF